MRSLTASFFVYQISASTFSSGLTVSSLAAVIAPALTARLTREILARGKVPFYCAAWSNIKSVRNALRCGYRPAWVELTARDAAYTETLARGEE